MVQTHQDSDSLDPKILHDLIEQRAEGEPRKLEEMVASLESRAEGYQERGDATITAGAPDEETLAEERIGNVFVRQLPDDPDCLRVSIGGPDVPNQFTYLVFRGDPESIEKRLALALEAMVEFNSRQHLRGQMK